MDENLQLKEIGLPPKWIHSRRNQPAAQTPHLPAYIIKGSVGKRQKSSCFSIYTCCLPAFFCFKGNPPPWLAARDDESLYLLPSVDSEWIGSFGGHASPRLLCSSVRWFCKTNIQFWTWSDPIRSDVLPINTLNGSCRVHLWWATQALFFEFQLQHTVTNTSLVWKKVVLGRNICLMERALWDAFPPIVVRLESVGTRTCKL